MNPVLHFEDDVFAYDEKTRDMLKLFVLGPANSSTYWHGKGSENRLRSNAAN